ncbi:MAG: hypothetical protein KDB04_19315 [Acidimicrobiales bacterium]|nr:hypothetical protein [Acidimicrobiales bacterium]HRW37184.1 hypothetical protein [Aquihabitans sp.]
MTDLAPAPTVDGDHAAPARPHDPATCAIPWQEIGRWTAIGVLLLLAWVMVDVARYGGSNPVSLIQPGSEGPSAEVVARDFPEVEPPAGSGLDGQQYYAIARDPLHLDRTADQLDNPRYRFQRPLLPWVAWAVQPTGGGLGLVWALFAVGLVGIVVGSIASGVLSTIWRGPPWVAAVFPLLPGAWWSLRVTVSDALALGLVLAAIALSARNRHAAAIAVGVLAVLAKEPAILLLLGWALHRRTRRDAVLVAVPAAVVVAWMGWLAVQLPPDTERANDIGAPFVGLVQAFTDVWSQGHELVGMACTLGGLALGGLALWRRGLRHPLGWALAVQLGFLLIMGVNPTSVNFGATRMAMPAMMVAVLALATPDAGRSADAARP